MKILLVALLLVFVSGIFLLGAVLPVILFGDGFQEESDGGDSDPDEVMEVMKDVFFNSNFWYDGF